MLTGDPVVLGLDASTGPSSVALICGDAILGESTGPFGRGADAWLLEATDQLVGGSGHSFSSLAAVVACTGPGAFTGIRVGVAAALGIARGLELTACGYSTLGAILADLRETTPEAAHRLACLDARRGEVYAQLETRDRTPVLGPVALSPDALIARLAALDRPIAAAGSGTAVDPGIPAVTHVVPAGASNAAHAARAIARMLSRGEAPPAAAPTYLRPPDAVVGANPLASGRRRRG